jgi:hypothetical protein
MPGRGTSRRKQVTSRKGREQDTITRTTMVTAVLIALSQAAQLIVRVIDVFHRV